MAVPLMTTVALRKKKLKKENEFPLAFQWVKDQSNTIEAVER
jgi:hypothetical protein